MIRTGMTTGDRTASPSVFKNCVQNTKTDQYYEQQIIR